MFLHNMNMEHVSYINYTIKRSQLPYGFTQNKRVFPPSIKCSKVYTNLITSKGPEPIAQKSQKQGLH